MLGPLQSGRGRVVAIAVALLLVASTIGAGTAAAHNPACHQTAGPDGPHYDDDPKTGSDTAYDKNPTVGGDFENANVDSCTVGNSQSHRSDN